MASTARRRSTSKKQPEVDHGAEFARRADQQTPPETVDAWWEDYQARLTLLRQDRSAVLPDLSASDQGKGRSRAVYNPR